MVTLNLVVPCFNEEEVLPETGKCLLALLDRLVQQGDAAADSAVTFVDDGSRDRTWASIEELHARDPGHRRSFRSTSSAAYR
jgi:glycosyltransferase involved in cell wall biosynthesis